MTNCKLPEARHIEIVILVSSPILGHPIIWKQLRVFISTKPLVSGFRGVTIIIRESDATRAHKSHTCNFADF